MNTKNKVTTMAKQQPSTKSNSKKGAKGKKSKSK